MLKIAEKDIKVIADCIKIPFLPSLPGEGKVCFATNVEVRPEFLECFNERHIIAYVSGYLHTSGNKITQSLKIPFPENADCFWKLVEKRSEEDLSYLEGSDSEVFFIDYK
jgi:hypothetical protein